MKTQRITPHQDRWQSIRSAISISLANHLIRLFPTSRTPDPPKDVLTVVCISDTHNRKVAVPPGDLLIHAGDLSQHGTFAELQAQISWLASQPHEHKVVIAGNHDLLLDPDFLLAHPERDHSCTGQTASELDWGDLLYIQDESRTLEFANGRALKIYGSPYTPYFGLWAFQYPPIRNIWRCRIPIDTDIIVTHGPPKGHLDEGGMGCRHLLKEVQRVRPSLVVFGHIHRGQGEELLKFDGSRIAFEDVHNGDAGLRACLKMGVHLIWQVLATAVRLHPPLVRSTRLVNAAVGGYPISRAAAAEEPNRGFDKKETKEAIVVCV